MILGMVGQNNHTFCQCKLQGVFLQGTNTFRSDCTQGRLQVFKAKLQLAPSAFCCSSYQAGERQA